MESEAEFDRKSVHSPPPPLVDFSEDEADDDGGDDDSDDGGLLIHLGKCPDLFSAKVFDMAEDCLKHCLDVHGFDVRVLRNRHSMDYFSYVRLVNYIRSENPSPCFVMSLASDAQWKDDKFMKPVLPDDPLLMVDLDSWISHLGDGASAGPGEADGQELLRRLRDELKCREDQLKAALEDMERMREVTRRLVLGDQDDEGAASSDQAAPVSPPTSAYAESYSHFGIHHEMLSDTVRTEAYRDAVALNADQFKGKRVLDIGCGTGILSMFCAKLGQAERVVGVDMSSIAYQAMDIVMENGLQDKVEIVKGRVEDLNPEDRTLAKQYAGTGRDCPANGGAPFDILISEWMGYFLLFEGMLDSVIYARDRFARSGPSEPPMVLPNRCVMNLVGVSDEQRHKETAGYFEDVYGFRMSCLRDPMIEEASVEVVPQDSVATTIAEIHSINTGSCTIKHTEFEADFELTALRGCRLTSLAGYFDAFFDLQVPVSFTTGPHGKPTHWKQTVFYLKEAYPLENGEKVGGSISVKRLTSNARSLQVDLTLCFQTPSVKRHRQTFLVT